MTGRAIERVEELEVMRYFQTATWGTVHVVSDGRTPHCGRVLRMQITRWLSETELDEEGLWDSVCCNCLRSFDRLAAIKEAPSDER